MNVYGENGVRDENRKRAKMFHPLSPFAPSYDFSHCEVNHVLVPVGNGTMSCLEYIANVGPFLKSLKGGRGSFQGCVYSVCSV